jgi:hypothetical protein
MRTALSAALDKNATLTSMQLGHNTIGAEGARFLAAALDKNAGRPLLQQHRR